MKRYDEDVTSDPYFTEETYACMVEEKDGQYVKYNEAQERENKLIDMLYENNKKYCPERIDLEVSYQSIHNKCDGINCKQCWIDTIKKELDK